MARARSPALVPIKPAQTKSASKNGSQITAVSAPDGHISGGEKLMLDRTSKGDETRQSQLIGVNACDMRQKGHLRGKLHK